MFFSNRIQGDLSSNRIFQVRDKLPSSDLIDLTESNPTKCGFRYPSELLNRLSHPDSLVYDPNPFGLFHARQAIAEYLEKKGQKVNPASILLTSSTSEAYSYIFKLLCDPGDKFLIPTPGYPLLSYLTSLEAVKAVPYPLRMELGWPADLGSIEGAVSSKTKGIIVVNPHNPTGGVINSELQRNLLKLCMNHSLAYVSDEVFLDYIDSDLEYFQEPNPGVLLFRLNGLSKTLGLPQLKLSWMVLEGPPELHSDCLKRLELISDTYLSVGTPIQLALADILKFAPEMQKQIKMRITQNRMILLRNLKDFLGVKIWPSQGGWYALIEFPEPKCTEEEMVISLLRKYKVMLHPGGFYDFPRGTFMVISLLPPEALFLDGLSRISRYLREQ